MFLVPINREEKTPKKLQLHHSANLDRVTLTLVFRTHFQFVAATAGESGPTFGTRAKAAVRCMMVLNMLRSPSADERRGHSHSHRPRGARASGEHIIECLVERVMPAGPATYPIPTKMNCNEWSLLMKIKLVARSLWGAVDNGDTEFQVDRMVLDSICSAVPTDMIAMLAVKRTAKEAWDCTSCSHSWKENPWRIAPCVSTTSPTILPRWGTLNLMTRSSTSISTLPAQGINSRSSLLKLCWTIQFCQYRRSPGGSRR
jgi:hypothetical protein